MKGFVMANQFYNSDTGINWSNVGDAALGAGVSAAASGGVGAIFSVGGSLLKGFSSSYFGKKSEKRAYERMRKQIALEYQYAQRYAENSPSWTVKGLRDAGINPMIPFMQGVPSSPSVGSHNQSASSTDVSSDVRYDAMLAANLASANLDNALKEDTLRTVRAENEVRRLKAEAEADLLRPIIVGEIEGDGKSVGVVRQSKTFKALQKGIADDYDLRSERYLRETAEAVMKYGLDVLKLLPFSRKKEILKKIIFDKKSNGPNAGHSATTAIQNEPVFQYD